MHVVSFLKVRDIRKLMQEISVDKYGIDIMSAKAVVRLIKLNNISNITSIEWMAVHTS